MVALKAEFQRELIIYRRYLFSSVSDLALTILMFMGIFWGSNSISKGIIGQSLSALIIGFTLWTTIQNTVSMLGSNTMNNAKSGILQQLYLMPISSEKLFFNRSMVNITISLGQSIIVCLALMLFTGQWINFTIMVSWMRLIISGSAYNFKYYLSFSAFNSIFWLLLGLFIFEKVNKAVKKQGSLSFY